MLQGSMTTLGEGQLAALARLFSASVVQQLARNGESALFARLLRQAPLDCVALGSDTVRSLFDAAFLVLRQRQYRHEYIYKAAIADKILLGKHNLNTATMLTEFRADGCKADVAILNGTSIAYEIKSERDRLDRLEVQLEAYLKVFAQVYVVTGENHCETILRSAPKPVGVLLLTHRHQISSRRAAIEDPSRIEPAVVFESLRVHEIREILALNDVAVPAMPNTKERAVLRELFITLTPRKVHKAMVITLRGSRGQTGLSRLVAALPASLRAAVVSTPLRKQDYGTLVGALDTRVADALSWA